MAFEVVAIDEYHFHQAHLPQSLSCSIVELCRIFETSTMTSNMPVDPTDPAIQEAFSKLGELEKDFAAVELDACMFYFLNPTYTTVQAQN